MKAVYIGCILALIPVSAMAQNSRVNSISRDISGTITTGGTYQIVATQSDFRANCTVQNPSTATEGLSVKLGTMAQPYVLGPGQAIQTNIGSINATDSLTVTAVTTGHAFAGTCQ